MYEEYRNEEQRRRVIGAAAAAGYLLLWVALLLFVKFNLTQEERGEGILINFGDVEMASGAEDPDNIDRIADAQSRPQSTPRPEDDEIMTQEHEEAPAVKVKKETRKKETAKPAETKPKKPAEEVPAEQPRQVNKKALFPGRTEGSKSTSEGTGEGKGNQGNPAGDPAGSHEGTGQGTSGNSFDLSGRRLVGGLPKPSYDVSEQGRVIVEITVNKAGKVVKAAFRSKGSTTSNSVLVNAALRAARQARFSVGEGEDLQTGTITYNFRMVGQ